MMLSKYVWKLVDQNIEYNKTWKIVKESTVYNTNTLNDAECFFVLYRSQLCTLNKKMSCYQHAGTQKRSSTLYSQ